MSLLHLDESPEAGVNDALRSPFFYRDGSTFTAFLGSPVPRVVRVGVERDAAHPPPAWGADKNQPASSDSCAVGVFRGVSIFVFQIQLFLVDGRVFCLRDSL